MGFYSTHPQLLREATLYTQFDVKFPSGLKGQNIMAQGNPDLSEAPWVKDAEEKPFVRIDEQSK